MRCERPPMVLNRALISFRNTPNVGYYYTAKWVPLRGGVVLGTELDLVCKGFA